MRHWNPFRIVSKRLNPFCCPLNSLSSSFEVDSMGFQGGKLMWEIVQNIISSVVHSTWINTTPGRTHTPGTRFSLFNSIAKRVDHWTPNSARTLPVWCHGQRGKSRGHPSEMDVQQSFPRGKELSDCWGPQKFAKMFILISESDYFCIFTRPTSPLRNFPFQVHFQDKLIASMEILYDSGGWGIYLFQLQGTLVLW